MDHQRRLETQGLYQPLPSTFLTPIQELVNEHVRKTHPDYTTRAFGWMWPDETLLALSVHAKGAKEPLSIFVSLETPDQAFEARLSDAFSIAEAVLLESLAEKNQKQMPQSFDTFTLKLTQNHPSHWVQGPKRTFLRVDRSNLVLEEEATALLKQYAASSEDIKEAEDFFSKRL